MTFEECEKAQKEGMWVIAHGYLTKIAHMEKLDHVIEYIEVRTIPGTLWNVPSKHLRPATAKDLLELQ
jgi:hypothetical protein